MTYCLDIDGTICTDTGGDYRHAEPFPDVIEQVNRLYDAGHVILLYTARGSTTGIEWREATEEQLRAWGVRHHGLYLGKPTADVYIDDKALNAAEWRRAGFQFHRENAISEGP